SGQTAGKFPVRVLPSGSTPRSEYRTASDRFSSGAGLQTRSHILKPDQGESAQALNVCLRRLRRDIARLRQRLKPDQPVLTQVQLKQTLLCEGQRHHPLRLIHLPCQIYPITEFGNVAV